MCKIQNEIMLTKNEGNSKFSDNYIYPYNLSCINNSQIGGNMEPDFNAYLSVMEEIKRRIEVITDLGKKKLILKYQIPHVESMVLQLRMVLELISLGSLAANKNVFENYQKKFESHWRLSKIFKDIESINPNFYPTPLVENKSNNQSVKSELQNLSGGYFSVAELIELHGRCGGLLHARNPYGKLIDYEFFENSMPNWISKIMNLLGTHKIQLLNDDKFYLVHMCEAQDDRVHMYTFQKID